jgi:uncharacterized protein (DUF488 family)
MQIVDVRTVPRSRHNPHVNSDTLADSLTTAGIAYARQPGLGELHHPCADYKFMGCAKGFPEQQAEED